MVLFGLMVGKVSIGRRLTMICDVMRCITKDCEDCKSERKGRWRCHQEDCAKGRNRVFQEMLVMDAF